MPIEKNDLYQIIQKSFPAGKIEIIDLVGDNNHYSVKIIDKSFAGKNRIEQHRMVNRALDKELKSDILHAMQLKTSVE
jgi:stress-induced morphogen